MEEGEGVRILASLLRKERKKKERESKLFPWKKEGSTCLNTEGIEELKYLPH